MSAGTRIALGARNGALRPALTTRIVAFRHLQALRWASSSRSTLPLSAAVSAAFSKAPVTPTKSTRTAPTRPAASVEVRGDGLPAYIPLQDPTPFTHPSFFQTTPWPFEQPRIVDGVPYTHYDNDKHVAFGDRILRMLVMDLVIESCPQLSASGTTSLSTRLISPHFICNFTKTYRLHLERLQADPAALSDLQKHHSIQSNLFRAYIAGLFNEQGYATTRIWVHQAFSASLGEQYAKLKQEMEETPAPSPGLKPVNLSAKRQLKAWAESRKVEIFSKHEVEGEEPLQMHIWRLRFDGREFVGRGLDKQAARSSASTNALAYVMQLDSKTEDKDKLDPSLPPPSAQGNRTSRFLHHCHENALKYTFTFSAERTGDANSHLCRLSWGAKDGPQRQVQATASKKAMSRDLAAKAALASMDLL